MQRDSILGGVWKRALIVGAVALLAAGCGGGGNRTTSSSDGLAVDTTSSRIIMITVKGGKPVGGITRVTVPKGEAVDLIVQSDVADEVHVHGYDLHKDVKPGGAVAITFKANITGVFEAELENRKLQILELTVK
jgi:hypothetical protein